MKHHWPYKYQYIPPESAANLVGYQLDLELFQLAAENQQSKIQHNQLNTFTALCDINMRNLYQIFL